VNAIVFPSFTVGRINDKFENRKLGKSRNTHRQQEANSFCKKSVKIYYSKIFNNNRKDNILCDRTFTVENSKSNEFITLVNDKV